MKNQLKPNIRFSGFTYAWEQKMLGDIVQITMGQSPSGNTYSDSPGEYILIQGNADLLHGYVRPRIWTSKITKQCYKGDLIMSVRAPAGSIGKTQYNCVIGRGIAAIKGNEFIYQSLFKMNADGYWKKVSCGSTFESLNSNNIKNAIISSPLYDEQIKIGLLFDNIDKYITLHQRKLDKIISIKKSLLEKMFPENGKNLPTVRFSGFTYAWEQCKLNNLLQTISFKPYIKEPEINGKFEIIQQGVNPIIGFAKGIPCLNYENLIIFGDHTLSLYKPKKPFFVSTDGVRIIKCKQNIDRFYLFSLLEKYKPQNEGYKRYHSILINKTCSFTDNSNEQIKIGLLFDNIDKYITLHKRKLEKFKNIKKSLLEKMFC